MSAMLRGMPPAERFPHGSRARYTTGCRCDRCRVANAEYERERVRARRRGDWNGLVDAAAVRQHLAKLSAAGVGYKSAADAASVARSVVHLIVSGERRQLRVATARRLLEVDEHAAAGGAVIDGRRTWGNIRWLLAQGMTRGEIAQAIGNERAALQVREDRLLASTAARIARLRRELEQELSSYEGLAQVCVECGYSHAPEDRQRAIRHMAGAETVDILEAWPCFYDRDGQGTSGSGYRLLMRDLAALRSRRRAG